MSLKGTLLTRRYTPLMGLAALAALVTPHAVRADTTTVTFTYTGGVQSFQVPNGVSSLFVQAWGAGGGGYYQNGGAGAFVSGDLAVTPGETLTIITGGGGSASFIDGSTETIVPAAGGYGGGGTANAASSGGGRSAILLGGTELVDAAGGGGGSDYGAGGAGGLGGGTAGGGSYGGGGGTQSGGGDGGYAYSIDGAGGGPYQGGDGGYYLYASPGINNGNPSPVYGGGGGGGGYYGGGGGGSESGGGGGSSLTSGLTGLIATAGNGAAPGGTTAADYLTGVGAGGGYFQYGGNGEVTISFPSDATPAPEPSSWTVVALSSLGVIGLILRARNRRPREGA